MSHFGIDDRGVKDDTSTHFKSLHVLRDPTGFDFPRAIVEVEFLWNETAMNEMFGNFYQRIIHFCEGIIEGLKTYFGNQMKEIDCKPTFLIDPGHGGTDHGAYGYIWENEKQALMQIYEKKLALKLASELSTHLESHIGATTFLSREDDINLSDQDRIRLADAYDVDAIISLHFASYPPNHEYGGWGVETFHAQSSQRDRNFAQSLHNSLTTNFTCKNRGVKNSTQSQNDALDILTIGTGDYLRSVISLDFPDSPKSFNINDSDSLQYVFGYNWDKQVIDFSYATISGCGIPIERM